MGTSHRHSIVIIGGGAAGIATAASLLKRRKQLDIAVIDPADTHAYQPGWTMVGGGIFDLATTIRPMASVMPKGVTWLKQAAASFQPEDNQVTLADGSTVQYDVLVVAPGIRLAWEKIAGLEDALGANGVTSNYRADLSPYTWELVQRMKSGRAIFSQPPMPIKCAGAPQKSMYLACDHWLRTGVLGEIAVEFRNAGGVLFGVAEYGASAGEVKAEFIWALPPAANDNAPYGGGDQFGGYAPLALVAENANSQFELYWVHGNHLGVPLVTTNAAGLAVDPGEDFLRPGFPGQSQVLSDLYYNRARDYDPVTGRYIQADPIGLLGGANPYLYANGDPVNMIDPSGKVPALLVPIGGAIVVGGANLLYQLYMSGGRWDCVDPWEVGEWALTGATITNVGGWYRGLLRATPKPPSMTKWKSWNFKNAVSPRLRSQNNVAKDVELHHWLVTQKMMTKMKNALPFNRRAHVDRIFNSSWNLNPVSKRFHQKALNPASYPVMLVRGAPKQLQGAALTGAGAIGAGAMADE